MYLKSIELTGFKSFAKKGVLEFTSPISAIVGPNGSGKSNVAESFRFVLGEQSIKSMRGKRGEDLIWNGSDNEPRANRASVKVVFDNSSKLFNIDFPEVTLERVVHRDGTNEYLINGSQVRLKDVLELLAAAHIGSSGHHIISQGEADRILTANPKERKAMIEDALGLKIYQFKRVESERKLTKTFENIAQVESLRKEIAPHLRFLKKQVEKIEKAENMRESLLSTGKEYFKREETYIHTTKSDIENTRKPLETKKADLDRELAHARSVLEKAAKSEKKDYIVLELEKEIAGARAHKDGLTRELGRLEGLISAEERTIKKEHELAASDETKMIRLKDVEDFARDIDETWTVRAVIDKLSDFIKGQKHSTNSAVLADAEKALESYIVEKEKAVHFLGEADTKEKELLARYEDLKREMESEKNSSHDAEKAVFRIMSEENEVISSLNMLKSREDNLKLVEEDFRRELDEVSRLVGHEILEYRSAEIANAGEDRRAQEERKREVEKLKIRLEDAGLSGADELLKEHREVSERDEFLAKELLDLEKSAESLRELIKELEVRLNTEFSTGLKKINDSFQELFALMFGGGDAKLMVTKSKKSKTEAIMEGEEVDDTGEEDEVVEEGLDISVSLPRKKVKGLVMLSGGERALTSIALIFAISQVNPPPFIILDETDAALDEANSRKYGDMVEKLSHHSQLILITHNRETMSRAGVIYGVTMTGSGASKLLSIEFDQAVAVAK
jgi:chromosome segregation protein